MQGQPCSAGMERDGDGEDGDGPGMRRRARERDKRHLFGLGSALREEGTEGMLDRAWRLS